MRALVLAGLFALGACAEPAEKRTAPVLGRGGAGDAGAGPAAAQEQVDPTFLGLTRTAFLAAKTVAGSCRIYGETYEGHRRYHDSCTVKPAEVKALRAATDAVIRGAPEAGASSVIAAHLRLFTESVEQQTTNGTLAHYQVLARAWNAFQPAESVPIDPIVKVPTYDEGMFDLTADAGTISWTRCSEGPCIIVPYKERNR